MRTTGQGWPSSSGAGGGRLGYPARHWLAALVGATVLGLAGCQWMRSPPAVRLGADRLEAALPPVVEAQMQSVGAQVFERIREGARQDATLETGTALDARVRGIVRRLAAASGAIRADAPVWQWDVAVIRSPRLDAVCLPGGKLIVHSGLLTGAGLNDDEIAALMAHDIAHVLRSHARERAGLSEAWRALPDPDGAVADEARRLAVAHDIMTGLPNSQPHETEADRLGVELAARAGFDPRALLTVLEKLDPGRHATTPEWILRHPSGRLRTQDLTGYAARVAPLQAPALAR